MENEYSVTNDSVAHFLEKVCVRRDWLYIVCPYDIGDFIISGGLSYAIQQKKQKAGTVLIVKEYLRNIGIEFPNVKKVIYLRHEDMDKLREYIHSQRLYSKDNYVYGHFPVSLNSQMLLMSDGLLFLERYKKDVYKLPMCTKLQKFVVKELPVCEKNILHEDYQLNSDKTIVLSPYAYSLATLGNEFWVDLADSLKEKGFIVYTNVAGGNEAAIPGTKELRVGLKEIFYIAGQIRCFLGLRSGLMDYLVHGNTRILCVSPIDGWWGDLKEMFPERDVETIYYLDEELELARQTIERRAKQTNMSIRISVSHKCIEDFHLCCTLGDLKKRVMERI